MSINTNYNYSKSGSYYQLASEKGSTNNLTTEQKDALKKIEEATGYSSSYVLDLSKDANDFLSNNTNNSSSNNDDTFILSKSQQKKLNAILEKYKDAPQTQETFNTIQDDLKKAGLDPDSLATKDKALSFNSIQVFLDILSGKTDQSDGNSKQNSKDDSDKYQTNKSNYLNTVLDLWKSNSL